MNSNLDANTYACITSPLRFVGLYNSSYTGQINVASLAVMNTCTSER